MVLKRRLYILIGVILLGSLVAVGTLNLPYLLPIQQKPEQTPPKTYAYYEILDAENDQPLLFVSVVVSVGDEVITEENKRYQVVRIEENRAYARFVENVDLREYAPKGK
ncbi:MAG: stage II sporulation protein P [Negativicutes bacterium]|nr:stage II sporulation protein P [Negativicutes bacterium]